jgi:hypothetical protein
MVNKFNFIRYAFLILTIINSFLNINGLVLPTSYINGANSKKQNLKLRKNNYNNLLCNEKFIYMKYLIGIRNFKKVYRIIKDNSNIDIQNIINIINIINNTQNVNITDNNSILINSSLFNNKSLLINNTNINNDKIAKNLILSNIYIDVSNVKYIQISTKNDTLIVELDKNNLDTVASNNIHNLMYDIGKIEALVSSISLIMKVLNIN